ncbi:hypothetical protein BD769DRAFT_1679306 [Suillus cothurnatus]|nr:hypothetical protein BD769DRAFT_1679306 [Suillus cothurnatus]
MAVRDEVIAGFCPPAKWKFQGRTVSSRQASSSKQAQVQIKVGAIAVLVNYLNDKGELLITILPVKTEMSKFKRRGCAYLDGDQSEDGGTFSKVSEYLDSVKVSNVKGKGTDNGASEWVLISKENRRLSVAPEPFPTGKHLEWYKGRNNAPFQQTNIFIGIPKFIPEHIYARWDPDMVVIDIDDDSDNSDRKYQEYNLKVEDDIFTEVPKIARPKRLMQSDECGTRQEPAQKKLRGTRGQPIASKMDKVGRASGQVKRKFFCPTGSDTDDSLDSLPATLKGMSISPQTQRHALRHSLMMPSIKDEEHHVDLQDLKVFAKAQDHIPTMLIPNRPLFQPLISV